MTCNGGRICVLGIGGAVALTLRRQNQHLNAFPGGGESNPAPQVMGLNARKTPNAELRGRQRLHGDAEA